MSIRSFISLLTFSLLIHLSAEAQDNQYVGETGLIYEDKVYDPLIRTVQFHTRDVPLSLPVIEFNTGAQLQLSFDDLFADYQDYSYTVIHCDRNWEPTDIPATEYIDGFLEENIWNYDFSMNAVQRFVHYSFTIPNQNFRLKLSGNYILLVFRDFDRTKPVITRRFRLYENIIDIQAEVRVPMIIDKRRTHHQINLEIEHRDYPIRNPLVDVAVHIQQNYRWDNMVTDVKPIFIKEDRLVYENMGEVLFEGSNEFRWVDIRSLRYQPENVDNIWYDPDSMMNHVFLRPDKEFSRNNYITQPDINGAYYIEFREGNDPDLLADYALVHFQLKRATPFPNGNLYIFGGLTNWRIRSRYKMDYNYRDQVYEGEAYLKQGYYNYQYMFLPDGEDVGQTEPTEGSFFLARQLYTFYVYHQQMGSRYDRLIGHKIISSRN